MDLLQFFKKKSPNNNLFSHNSPPLNLLDSISTSNRKESKEEFISKLEQYLNSKLQKKENKFLVKLMLCDKKHSSARYKHPFIEVRLSKYSSKKILQEHSELLISKLSNKLSKKQSKFPTTSYKNSTYEFIKSIQRGYFYVANCRVNIILNSTKTIIRIEKNINSEYNEKYEKLNQKINEITISLPNINIITNIFSTKNNIEEVYIQKLTKEELSQLKKVEQQVAKCLCSYFQKFIQDKVIELNLKTLKSPLNNISFNYVHSKWGHCTSKNDIMLHISLLNSPLNVFEYVIYHELAHTIEKNHSQAYWRICNSLTSHTKYARTYLKNSPPILFMEYPNLEIKLH